jgi:hypothetical protein
MHPSPVRNLQHLRLNPVKCKTYALENFGTNGLRMRRSAERQGVFLLQKIDHDAATAAKLINLPHQHSLQVLGVCVQLNLRDL